MPSPSDEQSESNSSVQNRIKCLTKHRQVSNPTKQHPMKVIHDDSHLLSKPHKKTDIRKRSSTDTQEDTTKKARMCDADQTTDEPVEIETHSDISGQNVESTSGRELSMAGLEDLQMEASVHSTSGVDFRLSRIGIKTSSDDYLMSLSDDLFQPQISKPDSPI